MRILVTFCYDPHTSLRYRIFNFYPLFFFQLGCKTGQFIFTLIKYKLYLCLGAYVPLYLVLAVCVYILSTIVGSGHDIYT